MERYKILMMNFTSIIFIKYNHEWLWTVIVYVQARSREIEGYLQYTYGIEQYGIMHILKINKKCLKMNGIWNSRLLMIDITCSHLPSMKCQ
jgi:hypothetical protein